MESGRVSAFSLESRVLKGNPLGDPTRREVWVWEPPGAPDRDLPVFLGLTGFTGTGAMAFHDSPWSPGVARRLDRMLADGSIPPLLAVFPDCFTRLGGSQYVNSSATGRYRDYVIDEVLPAVEDRFPARRDRDHRFVFGKSSGGFGALSLGMDRPEVFGGVGCLSGDMGFEYSYFSGFPKAIAQYEAHGGIEGFLKAFDRAPKKTGDMIGAMDALAMAACYSPTGEGGAYDLPFEFPSGKIRTEVWDRWLEFDPVRRAPKRIEALRSLRVLYIDCGTRDEFNLHLGARMLREILTKASVSHLYEEFDDGHMGISYRYDRCLPAMAAALP